jgi:hypothetical protein
MLTASRPEAQNRLICVPATVSGKPAAMAAVFRDIGSLVTDGRHTTKNQIIHVGGIKVGVPRLKFIDEAGDKAYRLHAVQ